MTEATANKTIKTNKQTEIQQKQMNKKQISDN